MFRNAQSFFETPPFTVIGENKKVCLQALKNYPEQEMIRAEMISCCGHGRLIWISVRAGSLVTGRGMYEPAPCGSLWLMLIVFKRHSGFALITKHRAQSKANTCSELQGAHLSRVSVCMCVNLK